MDILYNGNLLKILITNEKFQKADNNQWLKFQFSISFLVFCN